MAADAPLATDKLTQLQDCFDQLATQMFLSLHHIRTHHPTSPIANQPSHSLPSTTQAPQGTVTTSSTSANAAPASPTTTPYATSHQDAAGFDADLRELSSDIVKRYQQIDFIIKELPGLKDTRAEQEERIQRLNEELMSVDRELVEARRERARLVGRVDEVIGRVRRL